MPPSLPQGPLYRPLGWPFLALLFLLVFLLAPVLLAGVSFAFGRVGIGPQTAFTLLMASLLGSFVNVPLWRLPAARVVREQVVSAFGVRWRIPVVDEHAGTIVAVNLGGALIPLGVSGWILAHDGRWWAALGATAIVSAFTYSVARPVPGLGIAVPALVPPLVAAAAALALAGANAAPAAFVGGTLGTLLGADVFNLRRLPGLGAAVASTGGAGTFDGVFLSGLLGVILATVL